MIDFDEIAYCDQCETDCLSRFIQKEETFLLNKNKSVLQFCPGQVIIKQGSFDSKINYIHSGIIKIVKEGENRKNTLIKLVGANNFLTFPTLENQQINPFTAIALTDVKICEINESFTRNLILDRQTVYNQLLEYCYSDRLFLMNRLHIVNTRNSYGKLAACLIYLSSFNKPNLAIFNIINRKDLAELSSISLESVNKILLQLKNDQIISMDTQGFKILRLDLITKLSQEG